MSKQKTKAPKLIENLQTIIEIPELGLSTDKPFIISNTIECPLYEMKEKHIIPVFVKDNEPVINHSDFIEVVQDVVQTFYRGETIFKPEHKSKPSN